MSFPERFLEEVKGRFRLSEYIGRSVPLKRAGREMVGKSPWTNEKTPSFYVNDDKQFFCDFSSGKTGDVFDWLREHDGLSFVEAVKRLADEAGVALPAQDEQADRADRRRRQLEGLLEQAQAWFRMQYDRSPEAQAYLAGRGLTPADVARFGVGYAPNYRTALRDTLNGAAEDLLAAGLIARVDDGQLFDRYRHRITFPIFDAGGRLISFGARALDPKARAKYLNGPDTELFDKGRQLYGLSEARKLLAAGPGPLLVVEGYMDVIACLRAGIAACAPMGTSLTAAQTDLMWRFHPEPTLCFDADAAGRRAAAKAMDQALPKLAANRSLRFYHVSGGKDPDDILRTQGADALRAQISRSIPFVEAIFQREAQAAPLDTPERRTHLRQRLRKIVEAIAESGLRREYGLAIRDRLDTLYTTRGKHTASADSMESAKALRESAPPLQSALAYWLLKDPARAMGDLELIEVTGFGHPRLDALAAQAVAWMLGGETDPESLARHLQAQGFGELVATLADPEERFAAPAAWARAYRALAEYLGAARAVEEAKGRLKTAADMATFTDLKTRRDAAKRAL